jgi:hypothetical protein
MGREGCNLDYTESTGATKNGGAGRELFDENTCVCRKLDSAILMVKAAKDRS